MSEKFLVSNHRFIGATKESINKRIESIRKNVSDEIKSTSLASQEKVNKLAYNILFDKVVVDDFESYDKNNDGVLSFDEARDVKMDGNALTSESGLAKISETVTGKTQKELLEGLSKNRNILDRIFLTVIARLFEKADLNKNGTLEKDEADQFLKQEFPRKKPFVEYELYKPNETIEA